MKSTATATPVLATISGQSTLRVEECAGLAHLPPARVGPLSADYYLWDKRNLLDIPTTITRAPGTKFSRTQTLLSGDRYNCTHYGHEESVPIEMLGRYPNPEAAKAVALRRVLHVILTNHELRSKDLLTGATVPKAAVGVKWNDGGDPLADVAAAVAAIFLGCGRRANTMTVSFSVHEALKKKYAGLNKAGVPWAILFAALFDVERYVVASAVINGNPEGEDDVVITEVWGDSVILSFTDRTEDLEALTAGRTYFCEIERSENDTAQPEEADTEATGVFAESLMSRDEKNLVLRGIQNSDEKLCAPSAIFHLEDVLA